MRWFSLLYSPQAYLTWRETVLPDPLTLPPPNHTWLFTCCLTRFYGARIGLSASASASASLPAKKNNKTLRTVCRRLALNFVHTRSVKWQTCGILNVDFLPYLNRMWVFLSKTLHRTELKALFVGFVASFRGALPVKVQNVPKTSDLIGNKLNSG